MPTKKPATIARAVTTASSAAASGKPGTGRLKVKVKAALPKRSSPRKASLWSEFFDRVGFAWHPRGLQRVTKQERMAYTLGLFYSQIQRNGAQLWLTNGYAGLWNTAVMTQLRELGTTTARKAALVLVEIRAIATLAYARESDLTAADDQEFDSAAALDALADRCSRLDRHFNKIANGLMSDVDTFLRDEPLRRTPSSTVWPRLRAMTKEMKQHWC